MTGNHTFFIRVVLFALGTIGAQFLPALPPTWLTAAAGLPLAACFVMPVLRPAGWFLAGFLWALFRADLVLAQKLPPAMEMRDIALVGTVSDLVQRDERYLKFDLDVEQVRFEGRPVDFRGRVLLRWYDAGDQAARELKAGSRWRFTARLKQPHGYYNPGGFDYEAYLFREGIRATGYVRDVPGPARLEAGRAALPAFRQAISDRLDAALADARLPALLRALSLGDRSGISDRRWALLQATGTSHLIAISGLHVGCAAGFGALLGLWAGRAATLVRPAVAAPRVAAAGALALAFVYAALSGFDVPAQRAFIMASVLLAGVLLRRHVWTARGLALALLLVLVLDPASVHDPGLWLSFGAVALILAWLSGRGEGWDRRRRVVEAVKLQVLLSVALVPLVAGFFGIVSLVAAPANLVAVPVVMFAVVPLCLAGVGAAAAGSPAGVSFCLGLADTVLGWLWRLLAQLGTLEAASFNAYLALWQAVLLMAGVAWLLKAGARRRWWGLLAGLALLAPGAAPPAPGAFRVAVLDVGQGLAAVVRTAGHALVYDTGPRYPGGFSLAEAVVIPYLRHRGVSELDALVISHGDNDHRGGFEALNAAFPGARILSSVAGELPGAEYCVRGRRWTWDGVRFEFLHPAGERPVAHNDSSCVLKISGRHGAMLLTGDIEAPAETLLERTAPGALRSDVLLVPHQGSATSSTRAFVDRVDPGAAVVSAGYLNRYGHPHPKVVERYAGRGIRLLNTARSGAVLVDIDRSGIRLRRWREEAPRYWLDRDAVQRAR